MRFIDGGRCKTNDFPDEFKRKRISAGCRRVIIVVFVFRAKDGQRVYAYLKIIEYKMSVRRGRGLFFVVQSVLILDAATVANTSATKVKHGIVERSDWWRLGSSLLLLL